MFGLSDSVLTSIRGRLTPLIGDVAQTIGDRWVEAIGASFTTADLAAVQIAKSNGAILGPWYILDFHSSAERLDAASERTAAFRTFDESVAFLLAECADAGVWPDHMVFQEVPLRVEFKLASAPFANIKLLPAYVPVESPFRARGQGTLFGCRKSALCSEELAKRIRKWPGLESLVLEAEHGDAESFHLPHTSEWLLSAKLLAQKSKVLQPSTSLAQSIAAAVFGEPSWNHLCAYFKSDAEKGLIPSLAGPWHLSQGPLTDDEDSVVFQDVFEGFQAFLAMSKQAIEDQPGGGFAVSRGLSGLPHFVCTRKKPDSVSPEEFWLNSWGSRIAHSLDPVMRPGTEEFWINKVRAPLKRGLLSGLRELFMLDSDASQKRSFRHAYLDQVLVCEDGNWVFAVDDSSVSPDRMIHATLMDESGNAISFTAAYLRKAQLNWHEKLGAFILSYEYSGHSPIAIIKGISVETAEKLIALFREQRNLGFSRHIAYTDRDLQDLLRMEEKLQRGGATLR